MQANSDGSKKVASSALREEKCSKDASVIDGEKRTKWEWVRMSCLHAYSVG